MRTGVASILFGALAVLLSVSAVVSALLSLHLLDNQRDRLVTEHLDARSTQLAQRIEANCKSRSCLWSSVLVGTTPSTTFVMTRDFKVVFGACPEWLSRHPAIQDVFASRQHQVLRNDEGRMETLATLRSIRFEAGDEVLLGVTDQWVAEQTQDDVYVLVLILSVNLVLILLFGTYLVNRSVVAPIARLESWVNQRRKGTAASDPPTLTGPKEIKRLRDAFASLLTSLEQKSAGLEVSKEKLASTQQQLAHRDRLVTVGRVASGIAHEVGNPLSSVIGFLSLLRTPDDLEAMGMSTSDVIQRMDAELERIRKAVRSLLDLSQPVAVSPRMMDVNTVVEDVETLIRVRTKKTVIHKVLGTDVMRQVYFDPSLLLQVLSNLCLNAVEAMDGEGRIDITLSEDDERSVVLSLTDSGPGIDPKIMDVIFDEFQTTKRAQGGTGLGLSISRSLLTLGGGELSLMSPQPSQGAGFVIRLPRQKNS